MRWTTRQSPAIVQSRYWMQKKKLSLRTVALLLHAAAAIKWKRPPVITESSHAPGICWTPICWMLVIHWCVRSYQVSHRCQTVLKLHPSNSLRRLKFSPIQSEILVQAKVATSWRNWRLQIARADLHLKWKTWNECVYGFMSGFVTFR